MKAITGCNLTDGFTWELMVVTKPPPASSSLSAAAGAAAAEGIHLHHSLTLHLHTHHNLPLHVLYTSYSMILSLSLSFTSYRVFNPFYSSISLSVSHYQSISVVHLLSCIQSILFIYLVVSVPLSVYLCLSSPSINTYNSFTKFSSLPVLQQALHSNQWVVNNELLADNITKQPQPQQLQPQQLQQQQQQQQQPQLMMQQGQQGHHPPSKIHIKSIVENGAVVVDVTIQQFQHL